jgi:hypothetical protein
LLFSASPTLASAIAPVGITCFPFPYMMVRTIAATAKERMRKSATPTPKRVPQKCGLPPPPLVRLQQQSLTTVPDVRPEAPPPRSLSSEVSMPCSRK